MLLQLSEVLACPACGPPQVMVAVVEEARGPFVRHGSLACPACDARYPIDEGVVYLAASREEDATPAHYPGAGAPATQEAGVLAAALLGLERGSGLLLFGPGLVPVAHAVANVAERWTVVCLSSTAPEPGVTPPNVSRLVVHPGEPFPLQSGRAWGVTLDGPQAEQHLAEAARVLLPGGLLVVLDPAESAVESLARAGLDVRASDTRAILATRPLSGQP